MIKIETLFHNPEVLGLQKHSLHFDPSVQTNKLEILDLEAFIQIKMYFNVKFSIIFAIKYGYIVVCYKNNDGA